MIEIKLSLDEDEFAIQFQKFKKELNLKLKNKSPATQARQLCEFIRDTMRSNLHSNISMALTFALGYCNSTFSSKMLFEQICAGIASTRERKGFEVLLFAGLIEKEKVTQILPFDELLKEMESDNELNNNPIKKVFKCLTNTLIS